MTVEQKAEEIMMQKVIKHNDCIMTPCKTLEDCQLIDFCFEDMVDAFIDGYHEGFKDCAKSRLNVTTISDCPIKEEWHDLEKDPTDLPPKMVSNPNFSIEVLSDKGEIVNYNFHFCEWYYWRRGKPIVWCEIPKYKEIE